MSSSLTQFTIYSSKNSKFSHTQHHLPRWKGLLQADVGNSMDLKETSIAVLNEQLFNHITNIKLISFQPLVLRHNSYCTHLDKWVICFLGTRKRFLLSLLPKANLKRQKHYSPRNSIKGHYRDTFITFNSKKQKREHNRAQRRRAFSNTL